MKRELGAFTVDDPSRKTQMESGRDLGPHQWRRHEGLAGEAIESVIGGAGGEDDVCVEDQQEASVTLP